MRATLANEPTVGGRMADFVANATDELLMNAIYDAPAAAVGGKDRVARGQSFQLPESVELVVGQSDAYMAVSVVDRFGSLNKSKLFQHILKCFKENDYQIDPTVAGAGIGLALTFSTGASFVFTTDIGKQTEVTLMIRKTPKWRDFRNQYRFVSVYVTSDGNSRKTVDLW
jgi:hypothetical protein